jgi:hypothetical protein
MVVEAIDISEEATVQVDAVDGKVVRDAMQHTFPVITRVEK